MVAKKKVPPKKLPPWLQKSMPMDDAEDGSEMPMKKEKPGSKPKPKAKMPPPKGKTPTKK
jgi:hypothetical protein